jgi:acyl carrier protein
MSGEAVRYRLRRAGEKVLTVNDLLEENEFVTGLRTLVANVLDVDEDLLAADTHFVDDLGVDSLMALELMVALEKEYKLKLTEENLREMTCLRKVHNLLLERLAAA